MLPQLVFFNYVLIDTGTSSFINMIDFANLVCELHISDIYIRKFPLWLFQKHHSMNALIGNFHSKPNTYINTLRTRQNGPHLADDILNAFSWMKTLTFQIILN